MAETRLVSLATLAMPEGPPTASRDKVETVQWLRVKRYITTSYKVTN